MRFFDLHPRRLFRGTWAALDDEAADARQSPEARGGTMMACVVFCAVAVSLTLQEYLGDRQAFMSLVSLLASPASRSAHPIVVWAFGLLLDGSPETYSRDILFGGYLELWVLCYWALWRILGFGLLPLAVLACYPRMRREGIGLSTRGFGQHAWVYAVLFVPVLVAVFVVSFDEAFSTYYPFYSQAHRTVWEFALWESFYIVQFFALELFFRGFMLQPLRRVMGSSAIFAMVVPYVMIHYGKPMLECFAAILAGVILGTLAMRTRSIWAGFLLHVSVALSMDLLSIWQNHLR